MHWDHLSFINPNYFYGCHPLNLRDYFTNAPFFENLDSSFPIQTVQAALPTPKPCPRQQALERILGDIGVLVRGNMP